MKNKLCLLALLLTFCSFQIKAKTVWKELSIPGKAKIKVEVVSTPAKMSLGLGNRNFLPKNEGMLFLYRETGRRVFWMKKMRFPIDILWIQSGKIKLIETDIQPPPLMAKDSALKTYGESVLADMVLEVPAGYSRKKDIRIGDQIQLTDSY